MRKLLENCHGAQAETRTQGARYNDTETLTTGNNTCLRQYCSGGYLVREGRRLGSIGQVHCDRQDVAYREKGCWEEGSIYYIPTTLYNSLFTPFFAIRLTLHTANQSYTVGYPTNPFGKPETCSVQLGVGALLQKPYENIKRTTDKDLEEFKNKNPKAVQIVCIHIIMYVVYEDKKPREGIVSRILVDTFSLDSHLGIENHYCSKVAPQQKRW